jgi:hypothetical protein
MAELEEVTVSVEKTQQEVTITTAYPAAVMPGDIIEMQRCMNDQVNMKAEIVAVSSTVLTLRRATWWMLAKAEIRYKWREVCWYFADAWYELCDDLREVKR